MFYFDRSKKTSVLGTLRFFPLSVYILYVLYRVVYGIICIYPRIWYFSISLCLSVFISAWFCLSLLLSPSLCPCPSASSAVSLWQLQSLYILSLCIYKAVVQLPLFMLLNLSTKLKHTSTNDGVHSLLDRLTLFQMLK